MLRPTAFILEYLKINSLTITNHFGYSLILFLKLNDCVLGSRSTKTNNNTIKELLAHSPWGCLWITKHYANLITKLIECQNSCRRCILIVHVPLHSSRQNTHCSINQSRL